MLDANERSQRARVAAHSKWAVTDPVAGTEAARAAALERFASEADPLGRLDPAERARRGKHLQRAHMARIALASAKARREKRERRNGNGATP